MILHQECFDYNKHCSISFTKYVQATQENNPANTKQSGTFDCMYLQYLSNKQGHHKLLHLSTGWAITYCNAISIPIIQHMVDLVHMMANNDKIPNGLKLTKKAD